MRLVAVLALGLVMGCSTAPTPAPVSTLPSTQEPPSTTSTLPPAAAGLPCPSPDFAPVVLPTRAARDAPGPESVVVDRWTAQPGTSLLIWTDESGGAVVALVRGTLPPERWSSTPSTVAVRGVDAALGPLSEGMWAVAWFEGPDRCDDYTLYLYPPTSAAEARRVAASIPG